MAARGRKSAASLAVVASLPEHRPAPPDDLTEEQAEEWRAIASRMPADWFTRETHPMLAQYCRHVSKARVLGKQIDAFDPAWLTEADGLAMYDRLTHMADRESKAIAMLGTKMRLTHQSRYKAEKAHVAVTKAGSAPKPWQKTGA
jgi:hypothetical protein